MKLIVTWISAVLLAVAPPLAPAVDSGQAARTTLKEAMAAAQKWQADAALTSVSTLRASPDGKSVKWGYMFYSAKAKMGYAVDFAGKKLVDAMEVRPHVTDAVAPDFVDSDKAMAIAKANGVDTQGQPFSMSLRVMGQSTKKPGTFWFVGGGFTKGAVAVAVDAKTGQFSFRQQVP